MANAYDELVEKLVDPVGRVIQLRTSNPQRVRVNARKALDKHNTLMSSIGMHPVSKSLQVKKVKGKDDLYAVTLTDSTRGNGGFTLVD